MNSTRFVRFVGMMAAIVVLGCVGYRAHNVRYSTRQAASSLVFVVENSCDTGVKIGELKQAGWLYGSGQISFLVPTFNGEREVTFDPTQADWHTDHEYTMFSDGQDQFGCSLNQEGSAWVMATEEKGTFKKGVEKATTFVLRRHPHNDPWRNLAFLQKECHLQAVMSSNPRYAWVFDGKNRKLVPLAHRDYIAAGFWEFEDAEGVGTFSCEQK